MQFGQHSIEVVKGAATVEKLCENCNNVTNHLLVDQPHGIGISIAFMKRPLWSSGRDYALMCPTCSWGEPISKDEAQALIRKGQSQ